ncbi:Ankyrin repeat protein [Rickettsiales bacterium Ac37b]|nr:Ankyrin repeat protein [Rickettsiales bacterium Ac37b]
MKNNCFEPPKALPNKEIKLIMAVKKGYTTAAVELIKSGVNKEIIDDEGYTPLTLAVINGHLDTAKELLKLGARIEGTGRIFTTPLYYSIKNNYPKIAQELIDRGAKIYINIEDNNIIKWRTTNDLVEVPENFLPIIKSGLYAESIYWGTSSVTQYIAEGIKIDDAFPRLRYLCSTLGIRRSLFQLDNFPLVIQLKIEDFLHTINAFEYKSPTLSSKRPLSISAPNIAL